MSKEYQVSISTKEETDLMKGAKILFDGVDAVELTWNQIYMLHGAISGILNRHQMLVS